MMRRSSSADCLMRQNTIVWTKPWPLAFCRVGEPALFLARNSRQHSKALLPASLTPAHKTYCSQGAQLEGLPKSISQHLYSFLGSVTSSLALSWHSAASMAKAKR